MTYQSTVGRCIAMIHTCQHRRMLFFFIAIVIGQSGIALCWADAADLATKRLNVLLYLVDDMGWMDSTVYGSKYYETPNFERLAESGMVFSNAYSASPLCSATRASLMTGCYPARLAITGASGHLPPLPNLPLMADRSAPNFKVVCPRSRRYLPLEQYTMAEAFRGAGFSTCFIGKWHLGHEPWWPEKQGFDVSIAGGHYPGPPSYHSPYHISTLKDGPEGEYLTDRLTNEALQYLDKNYANPFFLCMWHYAVHAPFQAKGDLIDRYRNKIDPRGKQGCPTMAAMVKSQDESLGKILDKLDELEIADNTLIILMSDNGGNMYDRVEGIPPTNNAPLRGGKATLYEGGTRVPCIVVWPGVVEPRSHSSEIVTSIDLYPTILEAADIKPNREQIFDGISLVPAFTNSGKLQREEIFCHFPHYIPATDNLPGTYVRQGDWKLIRLYGEGPDRSANYELYNLKDDISEQNNLADRMPGKVRKLDALITNHLEETGAFVPFKNPDYGKKVPKPFAGVPVEGWQPAGTATLKAEKGKLLVTSTGADPYFHTADVPSVSTSVVFSVRMKSNGDGAGQAFWGTKKEPHFHRSRSMMFDIKHDNNWQEYQVNLPVKGSLHGLRLDPGTAAGKIEIDWIRLQTTDGHVLKAWDF